MESENNNTIENGQNISERLDRMESDENVMLSASGANPELPEMTVESQKRHIKHLREGKSYPGMSLEKYVQKSAELARSPIGGDIDGYKAEDGSIVRYNKVTNDWARGRAIGVVTMFKPDLKEVYFEKWLELDKGVR